MASQNPSYTRLPGRGVRVLAFGLSAQRCRLYLGTDHLLSLEYTVASETYRRFYYSEIEAIVLTQTSRRQVLNWVFGFIGAAGALPLIYTRNAGGDAGAALGIGIALLSPALLGMLINSLRGAGCKTMIRTAAQEELLPSLCRVPTARKALAALRPRIEQAQGLVVPEEVAATPWSGPITPVTPPFASPNLYLAMRLLLLAQAAWIALTRTSQNVVIQSITVIAVLSGFAVAAIAFARFRREKAPGKIQTLSGAAIFYYLLLCLTGFGFFIAYSVHHPGVQVFTGIELLSEPGYPEAALIAGGVGALLGLISLTVSAPATAAPQPRP